MERQAKKLRSGGDNADPEESALNNASSYFGLPSLDALVEKVSKRAPDGYNSPQDYLDAEFDGRSLESVLNEVESRWKNVTLNSRESKQIVDLTKKLLTFYCNGPNDGSLHEIAPLDKLWLEGIRVVCDDINSLAATAAAGAPRIESIATRPEHCPRGKDILTVWKVNRDKHEKESTGTVDDGTLGNREELVKKALHRSVAHRRWQQTEAHGVGTTSGELLFR